MKLPIDPSLLATHAINKAQPASQKEATSREEGLRRTCETFEAIFTQQLFKSMRASVDTGGLLPKSQADEIFSGLMDKQVARDLASQGSLGIADMLFAQLRELEDGSRSDF